MQIALVQLQPQVTQYRGFQVWLSGDQWQLQISFWSPPTPFHTSPTSSPDIREFRRLSHLMPDTGGRIQPYSNSDPDCHFALIHK